MSAPSTDAATEIVRRRGGWFVTFPDGWSGPWRTEEAAKLAKAGRWVAAHDADKGGRQ